MSPPTPTAPMPPMATSDLSALVPHTHPSHHSRTSALLLHTSSERIVGALLDVWSMHPNEMQIHAVTSLVDIDVSVCGGKVLLVVKTGAGKSHIMHTTGVLLAPSCSQMGPSSEAVLS
eukprot:scaffold17330_cov64-Attheya_sp.AAC.3